MPRQCPRVFALPFRSACLPAAECDLCGRTDRVPRDIMAGHLLVAAYFVFHLGNMVGWVPYVAIVPELPSHQRAAGAAIIGFTTSGSLYLGSMLGLFIGQSWISHDTAFAFMLMLNIINLPLGCLAMGDRPGCFSAERPVPDSDPGDAGKSCATMLRERLGSPRRICETLADFLSAFRDSPAYRWYFLQAFVGTLNPFGVFIFYWYQDCFAPRFTFFGWHLASSPQSATAILVAVGQIITTVTSLPGGLLDTAFFGDIQRRKRIMLLSQIIGAELLFTFGASCSVCIHCSFDFWSFLFCRHSYRDGLPLPHRLHCGHLA